MGRVTSNAARLLLLGGIVLSPFVLIHTGAEKQVPEPGKPAEDAAPAAAGADMVGLQESFVRIADRVKPAVVNIATVFEEKGGTSRHEFFFGSPFEEFFDDFFREQKPGDRTPKKMPRQKRLEGTGSGVIIDEQGYILTNEHVVRGAKYIKVTLTDGKSYKGKVVGKDAHTDLAIIKIKAGNRMPHAKLGDSTGIRVGEWAIAIGSPFGLEETVTTGIISAVRQSLAIEGHDYRNLIQTDAAINRGNSGGPLCNINGEVIGINTAIYAPTGVFAGVGFAIPINGAKEIMADLIHKGKVVRGWLGIEVRSVDEVIAAQFGLSDRSGLLINNVLKDSPASKAGLRRGDIIREFEGRAVGDVRSLQATIAQIGPRRKVSIKLIRDGRELVIQMLTGEMPPDEELVEPREEPEKGSTRQAPHEIVTAEWQGMSVVPLNDKIARKFGFPPREKGCIVVNVEQGSAAEEMGLAPGDLIRSINRSEIPTLEKFQSVTGRVKTAQGIVLDVNRQGKLFYLSYKGEGQK
ncbi:MAG: Do family serine endopeptidase [Endomicrobiales bacterium]